MMIVPENMKRLQMVFKRHLRNVVLMLGHRLRRWPNIETTLHLYLVFPGWVSGPKYCIRSLYADCVNIATEGISLRLFNRHVRT